MLAQAGGSCPSGTRQGELPRPPTSKRGDTGAAAVPRPDSAPPPAWHLEHVQAPEASPRARPQLGQHRVPSRGTLHSLSPPLQRRPGGSSVLLGQGASPQPVQSRAQPPAAKSALPMRARRLPKGFGRSSSGPKGFGLLQFRPAGLVILTNPLLCPDVRREARHGCACRATGVPEQVGATPQGSIPGALTAPAAPGGAAGG